MGGNVYDMMRNIYSEIDIQERIKTAKITISEKPKPQNQKFKNQNNYRHKANWYVILLANSLIFWDFLASLFICHK